MYPRPPGGPGYPFQGPPGGFGGAPYGGTLNPYAMHPGGYSYPGQTIARPPRHITSAPPRRPGGNPTKNTTLWVGKIALSVEPELIKALLEACGPVKEWKPATDPETGKMKGFGFCTYQEPEGVMLALRLLNGLNVDGQEMALKCNKATEEFIEWYEANSKAEQEKPEEGAAPVENSEPKIGENEAFEKIMGLVGERSSKKPEADATAAADAFLSNLQSGGPMETEPAYGTHRPATSKREREVDRRDRDAEREAQRQRREEQRRQEQEERAIRDAVRLWEAHEREWHREVEKELDRERDLLRERARQLRVDNEIGDSDDEEEPWRRRPYKQSRRAGDRRRRREQELKDDAADQERERVREEQDRAKAAAMAAAQEKQRSEPPSPQAGSFRPAAKVEEDTDAQVGGVQPVVAQEASGLARRKAAKAAFVEEEEEEEDKPKRTLVPIKYSEEELRGLHGEPGSEQPSSQQPSTDAAQLKRQLMAKVPKERGEVFAYSLKWSTLDNAPPDVKERVSGWVTKKIKDLMGEEEPSFCEFIMSQVLAHTPAEDMLQALKDVLDEDADSFVMKLFQVLIYETEKLALV